MNYRVVFSPQAADDLERLFDHILERELASPTGDLDTAERAMASIRQACQLLTHSPFSCRKVGLSSFVRELIISFGASGYVALFEIVDVRTVIVGAIRHQNESDYH
ncbi:MAG: type II toxin-antitoxin system RelE/ParE family toxin [Burkholderiales bacterium]|nr:type II toxin-antitoxin system RelE/ParE family toxin [Burkholderiales bacterium]MBK9348107.1 type II toxin-antitoxin system RelE/ParE family toxin [Burkholderiales bacterium]MBP8054142.1 type II toxin-antitoxin system RelE/ParE family toxin [Burkholderiaceae bacterium]